MSEPILFDPRINASYTVWHEDPNLEALVNHIMETLKPDRFVETGTHMGWTCMYMAKRYPSLPIRSVEIDGEYFSKSVHNCKPHPNVMVFHMSSPDFLNMIYFDVLKRGLTLFWLDAHWWTPVPLRAECRIIAALDKYVVLIDDFASKNPDFGGDVFSDGENNLAYVADILGRRCYVPNYPSLPPYHKGYGLFLKGVDYKPPETMREEKIE